MTNLKEIKMGHANLNFTTSLFSPHCIVDTYTHGNLPVTVAHFTGKNRVKEAQYFKIHAGDDNLKVKFACNSNKMIGIAGDIVAVDAYLKKYINGNIVRI